MHSFFRTGLSLQLGYITRFMGPGDDLPEHLQDFRQVLEIMDHPFAKGSATLRSGGGGGTKTL